MRKADFIKLTLISISLLSASFVSFKLFEIHVHFDTASVGASSALPIPSTSQLVQPAIERSICSVEQEASNKWRVILNKEDQTKWCDTGIRITTQERIIVSDNKTKDKDALWTFTSKRSLAPVPGGGDGRWFASSVVWVYDIIPFNGTVLNKPYKGNHDEVQVFSPFEDIIYLQVHRFSKFQSLDLTVEVHPL
jgi:hypothetical protein